MVIVSFNIFFHGKIFLKFENLIILIIEVLFIFSYLEEEIDYAYEDSYEKYGKDPNGYSELLSEVFICQHCSILVLSDNRIVNIEFRLGVWKNAVFSE